MKKVILSLVCCLLVASSASANGFGLFRSRSVIRSRVAAPVVERQVIRQRIVQPVVVQRQVVQQIVQQPVVYQQAVVAAPMVQYMAPVVAAPVMSYQSLNVQSYSSSAVSSCFAY